LTSVLDILINEIANVLRIPPSEVKSKFTDDQLKDLLNSTLCEPVDEVGAPFGAISELPCDDLAIPKLLQALPTDAVKNQYDALVKKAVTNEAKKCIDAVDRVTSDLQVQIENYHKYKNLLDKLIEYKDNFIPIKYYYEERSAEMSRILGDFDPLLTKLNGLTQSLNSKKSDLANLINSITPNSNTSAYSVSVGNLNSEIADLESEISATQALLDSKDQSVPILNDATYQKIIDYLGSPNADPAYISQNIALLYNNYVDQNLIESVDSLFLQYSEGIRAKIIDQVPTTIQQAVDTSYFSFSISIPQLDTFKFESESVDRKTGDRKSNVIDFPIRKNPLLEKQTFFEDSDQFKVYEFEIRNNVHPTGDIYTKYYNLLNDPLNNFFTLDDRGLTTEASAVDPLVKGTSSEKKREAGSEYFIKDLKKLQDFYQSFETTLENKKAQVRAAVISPKQAAIKLTMQTIARKEIQFALALGRVNVYLPSQNSATSGVIETIKRQNQEFLQKATDLDQEIARVQSQVDKLKPTPDNVKASLKKESPECFDKIDQPVQNCGDTSNKLGSDPLYVNTIKNGSDPTLPNSTQLCYWMEFAKVANLLGLLPIPNLPNITELRYWPVGLTIPTPGGLIKIPLPVIWLPLIVISTPMGSIVFFLTINGVFISPVIFFVSSNGFKQHIFTIRGTSPKFGYSSQDESIKPGVQMPLAALAAEQKANRLAQELANGANFNLSPTQLVQLNQQRNILNEAESIATKYGNSNRLMKIAKEKANLEQSISNLTDAEKLQKMIDKTDSIKDVIEDAKRSVLQRIDDLGKPVMSTANSIKSKITDRTARLLSDLQSALVNGDDTKAKEIRAQMKSDGVSLDEKLGAIRSDLMHYFDRITLPTVTIPKDSSTLEPKQNAILDFLAHILEFSSMYRTQFISQESVTVKNILLVQLAKSKDALKQVALDSAQSNNQLNIEKDFNKVQKLILEINSTLIDTVSGKRDLGSLSAKQQEVADLQKRVNSETDPAAKAKLQTQLAKSQAQLSNIFENQRIKEILALTPEVIATLSSLKVEFDPFAPCCAKKAFSLDLSGISPAIPVFESVKLLLDQYVMGLSPQNIKSLFGGKSNISPRELVSGYIGIIKNSIPASLSIPAPAINLLTFASSFAGVLTSLFEIKVPNVALEPALPARISIDLNILKKVLADALLAFLNNSLPHENSASGPTPQSISSAAGPVVNGSSGHATVDPSITIVNCDTDTSQTSILSNGNYDPNHVPLIKSPTSSLYSSGNILVASDRDILPAFQTLAFDFLSLNPGDLLAILKNFVTLGFDTVEHLLDPFYQILSAIKGAHGVNLNLLESVQYLIPPGGPPAFATFTAFAKAKQFSPKSSNFNIIDATKVEAQLGIVESVMSPIANSPLPTILVAGAGALDSILPVLKIPQVSSTGTISTTDSKVASLALRSIHPLVSQDDIPSWERLSPKNILFLLFLDEFLANGADKLGLFRAYL